MGRKGSVELSRKGLGTVRRLVEAQPYLNSFKEPHGLGVNSDNEDFPFANLADFDCIEVEYRSVLESAEISLGSG